MRYVLPVIAILFSTTVFSAPSYAISDQERIDQLERDVLVLQRKLTRQGDAPSGGGDDVTGMNGGSNDNRITALEEEVRTLRGKLEEKEFETKQVSEQLELMKRDVEFRFGELEKNNTNGAGATPAPNATAEPAKPAAHAPAPTTTPAPAPAAAPEASVKSSSKMEVSVKDAPTEQPAPAANGSFATPRDHYNYAFRLLNQNQHDEAAKSFTDFIAKNPKDPLVGNAYYWLGETYYIRGDYAKATDQFRQGFETMPKGPKAADNLLKLAMSLGRENKNKEACVVLTQVIDRYKTASPNTAAKATSEHKRLSCG